MDNSQIDDTLDAVTKEFRRSSDAPEEGLAVDDPALLQLRKACRLLEAVNSLQADNGYYTVIIEASFAAIERTIQFYLLETGLLTEDDYVSHETVYERGESAGLYGPDFKDKLIDLWENNRSRTYYREGVGTGTSAQLMTDLARQIHEHVLHLAGATHECICNTE